MRQDLKTLSKALYSIGQKGASYSAYKLLKKSYLNNAYILIQPSNFSIKFSLMGQAGSGVESYGEVVLYPLDNIKNKEYSNAWHIHSGVSQEIIGLGYGKDLYLTAIKYITDMGGVIISGPARGADRSDHAVKLHNNLGNILGIDSKEAYLIETSRELSDGQRTKIINEFEILELGSPKAQSYIDEAKESRSYNDEELSSEVLRKTGINYSQALEGDNYQTIAISIGNILSSSKESRLPISLPTRMDEEAFGEQDYKSKYDPTTWKGKMDRLKSIKDIRNPPAKKEIPKETWIEEEWKNDPDFIEWMSEQE